MSNATPPSVLVADSNRDCADSVALLLNGAGMHAHAVYGGRAAIALADKVEPASAVLDIAMPEISGLDVARHLRKRYGGDVRIVAYTAWTGFEDRRRAAEAGFERVVAKDADPLDLLDALAAVDAATMARSLAASRRQLDLRLELVTTQIDKLPVMCFPDVATGALRLVSRTLDAIDATLRRIPMEATERSQYVARVARLRAQARIAARKPPTPE